MVKIFRPFDHDTPTLAEWSKNRGHLTPPPPLNLKTWIQSSPIFASLCFFFKGKHEYSNIQTDKSGLIWWLGQIMGGWMGWWVSQCRSSSSTNGCTSCPQGRIGEVEIYTVQTKGVQFLSIHRYNDIILTCSIVHVM